MSLFMSLHFYPVGSPVYGDFSRPTQVAMLVGQIVVPSLGGPLLGIALGRWVRFPGAAFVVGVLTLVGAVLLPWLFVLTRAITRERAARVRCERERAGQAAWTAFSVPTGTLTGITSGGSLRTVYRPACHRASSPSSGQPRIDNALSMEFRQAGS